MSYNYTPAGADNPDRVALNSAYSPITGIVTGNLTMSGNPNFDGLILVLGAGTVNRDGGGDGSIYGAMTVARFDPVNSGPFLSPTFNTNGGGNSTMQYDSDAVRKALNASGPRVWGVREY